MIKSLTRAVLVTGGAIASIVVLIFCWPFVVAGLIVGWLIDTDNSKPSDILVVVGSFSAAIAVWVLWLTLIGLLEI